MLEQYRITKNYRMNFMMQDEDKTRQQLTDVIKAVFNIQEEVI